jgi:hypothetical protein
MTTLSTHHQATDPEQTLAALTPQLVVLLQAVRRRAACIPGVVRARRQDPAGTLARADGMLYGAKRAGKNQVMSAN